MASNFDLSESLETTVEKTNHDRLCRLVKEGGTMALKAVFDRVHPPNQLAADLMDPNVKQILQNALKRKIITPKQHNMLYPTPHCAVNSMNFDITLLMVLLRNICNLKQPPTGWDKLPKPESKSVEADICRIKHYRNALGHGQTARVSNVHFNGYWEDICGALVRLGADRRAIDRLKTDIMDSELEQRETEEVLDRAREGVEVKELLQSILKSIFMKKIEEITCSFHENNRIELFCTDCQVPICQTCGLGRHKESEKHVLVDLIDAARIYKDTILVEYNDKVKQKEEEVIENITTAKKSYELLEGHVSDQIKSVGDLPDDGVDKEELIKELTFQYKVLREDMEEEIGRLTNLEQTFKHTRAFIRSLMQIESEAKLMSESTILTNQIDRILHLETELERNYDVVAELSSCETSPSLSFPAQPSLTFLEAFDVAETVKVGETIVMNVVAMNYDCEKVTGELENLEASVLYENQGWEKLKVVPSDSEEETHMVTFTASKSGKQEISVKLRGSHIKGSPVVITVLPCLELSRLPCRQYTHVDKVRYACTVTIDNHGNLVLGDPDEGQIQVLEKQGSDKRNFTISTGVGSFSPHALTVAEDNSYFCVNRGNDSAPIVVCDATGKLLRTFGQNKLKGYVHGIAIDKLKGVVYVGDEPNEAIAVFSAKDGTFLKRFGELSCPSFIVVNSKGYVIATDSKESVVKIFSPDGDLVRTFGDMGTAAGEFFLPVGIALDEADNIYICDVGNHRVQKFDREGNFLSFCIERGLEYPEYIAVSGNRIYVTDKDLCSVKYLDIE